MSDTKNERIQQTKQKLKQISVHLKESKNRKRNKCSKNKTIIVKTDVKLNNKCPNNGRRSYSLSLSMQRAQQYKPTLTWVIILLRFSKLVSKYLDESKFSCEKMCLFP